MSDQKESGDGVDAHLAAEISLICSGKSELRPGGLLFTDELDLSEVAFTRAEYGAIDSLRDEVRCQAARDAKSQAESMAGAIGQSIGKCIYMHGGYSGNAVLYAQPRLTKALMADFANGMETVEENVEFGDITVSATVTARFELQ